MSKRRYSSSYQQRDIVSSIANRRLFVDVYRLLARSPLLRMYEDRRAFHPLRDYRAARSFSNRGHGVVVSKSVADSSSFPRSTLRFAVPNKVLICVRRKERKEVLHALGRVGRGSGGGKKHRNQYSEVHC